MSFIQDFSKGKVIHLLLFYYNFFDRFACSVLL